MSTLLAEEISSLLFRADVSAHWGLLRASVQDHTIKMPGPGPRHWRLLASRCGCFLRGC